MNTEQLPKALRLAEKLRDIIRLLDCDFADDIDTNDLRLAAMELESLYTRVQELETLAATLNVWQQAIDAELVSAHLGVAHNDATFEGAQKAIHELICWHIDVATNPATNGGQRLTDAKPIVWPEPAGRLITGPHGLFVSYNSSIAATPGNLYTRAQVEAMLEAQGVRL